jgi:hypothetical protein
MNVKANLLLVMNRNNNKLRFIHRPSDKTESEVVIGRAKDVSVEIDNRYYILECFLTGELK